MKNDQKISSRVQSIVAEALNLELDEVHSGAVQEELQRQKRPGGILSPYGAA